MAKVRYRVRNWSEYNRALVNRYRLEVWLSEDVARGWYARPTGRRGRQPVYSDLAITFCLTIRALFDLPLRGCQGLLESVLSDMGLPVPDYSVMCRRAPGLEVSALGPAQRLVVWQMIAPETSTISFNAYRHLTISPRGDSRAERRGAGTPPRRPWRAWAWRRRARRPHVD